MSARALLFVNVTPCAKAATRTATVHRCAITARTCARVPYGESGCEKKGARHRRRSFHAGCCSTIRQYDIHHFVLFCLCAVRNSSTIPQRAVSRRHLLLHTGRRFQPEPTLQDIEIRQNLPDLDVQVGSYLPNVGSWYHQPEVDSARPVCRQLPVASLHRTGEYMGKSGLFISSCL